MIRVGPHSGRIRGGRLAAREWHGKTVGKLPLGAQLAVGQELGEGFGTRAIVCGIADENIISISLDVCHNRAFDYKKNKILFNL